MTTPTEKLHKIADILDAFAVDPDEPFEATDDFELIDRILDVVFDGRQQGFLQEHEDWPYLSPSEQTALLHAAADGSMPQDQCRR